MKSRARAWKAFAVFLACVASVAAVAVASGQEGPPNLPVSVTGQVTVLGQSVPDGVRLFARIVVSESDVYESKSVTVSGGQYFGLVLDPSGIRYAGRIVRFYMTQGADEVEASETVIYRMSDVGRGETLTLVQNLTFPRLPALPTPTPTHTPTPGGPTPTATATPVPTPTPGLPIPGDPMVRSVALWAVAVGALGLVVGVAVLRLAGARR